MLIILSPSKTQDFTAIKNSYPTSIPRLINDTKELVTLLKQMDGKEIAKLMTVSDKISELNVTRYQQFDTSFPEDKSKPAIYTFKGDVYNNLELIQYNHGQFEFLNKHFRIISGLYGLLRPLDLIQGYRLEMSTPLKNDRGNNLYQFWGDKITNLINQDIKETNAKYFINLASNEYSSSVNMKLISLPIITINFKENRGGTLKTIALNSKRARSLISNFIIKNGINNPMGIKEFKESGYSFNNKLSSESEFVFIK